MSMSAGAGRHHEFFLYPNRSLGTPGFVVLMAATGLVAGVLGAAFMVLGAWPVTGFLGLDMAALYLAFRLVRHDRRRFETIRVTPQGCVVRRVGPSGQGDEVRFEGCWARVLLERRPGRHPRLSLASHGRAVEIGRFLTDDEKAELAAALEQALRSCR